MRRIEKPFDNKTDESMRKIFDIMLLTLSTLMGLVGCSVDNSLDMMDSNLNIPNALSGEKTEASNFAFYLRLEDAEGGNLFDREGFDLMAQTQAWRDYTDEWCQTVRGSDQAKMGLTVYIWRAYHPEAEDNEVGLVYLTWDDMELLSLKTRPNVYDETYTTSFRLANNGVSEMHEIKWTLHVNYLEHWTTGCELDGVPVVPETVGGTPTIPVKIAREIYEN